MIAYITGSGFYEIPGYTEEKIATPFGDAHILRGKNERGVETLVLPRHGVGHARLPHHINYRAHLRALAECGATAIVSTSVCGVINSELPLAAPFVVDEIYYPDNRLGDGSICSFYNQPGDPMRGHLLAGTLLHSRLSAAIHSTLTASGLEPWQASYAHVPGPRFNTKVEIRALQALGLDILSQTCGPEAVLANELELPYALLGFGLDYANGVHRDPTPIDVLQNNLERAKTVFTNLIDTLEEPSEAWSFENFVYRFPS